MSKENQEMWDQMGKLVEAKLQAIIPDIQKLIGSGTSEPKKTKSHSHFSDDEEFCPDCYPSIRKKVLEKEILARKENPLECVNCGTRVTEDEDSCPTCGSTEAREY